mgnify:CR=1 FL=1
MIMKRQGFVTGTVLGLAMAAGFCLAAFVADFGWVDVQTQGEDAVHIVLPLPMDLLPLACCFVPDEARQDEGFQQFLKQKSGLAKALAPLKNSPAGCLARVQSPGGHVEISKIAGRLAISVDAPDARVRVSMPLGPVIRAMQVI